MASQGDPEPRKRRMTTHLGAEMPKAKSMVTVRKASTAVEAKSVTFKLNAILHDEARTEDSIETKRCTLLAGKVAFNLEAYLFRKVLPARLIRPHIFPRNMDDLSTLITKYKSMGEEGALEGADKRWKALRAILRWDISHERVLEYLKQACLMVHPSQDILLKLSTRDINEIRRAFQVVLPNNLQQAGLEVVDMLMPLGLT